MGGLPTWTQHLLNPLGTIIGKSVGGDTGLAVADPFMYLMTNDDRQAKARAKADKDAKEAAARAKAAEPKAPSPFTTQYKSPWEL